VLGNLESEQGPGEEKMLPWWQEGEDFKILKANWEEEEGQLSKNLSKGNQVLGILCMASPHCCEKGGCEIKQQKK